MMPLLLISFFNNRMSIPYANEAHDVLDACYGKAVTA
jgi:hypothetical protein